MKGIFYSSESNESSSSTDNNNNNLLNMRKKISNKSNKYINKLFDHPTIKISDKDLDMFDEEYAHDGMTSMISHGEMNIILYIDHKVDDLLGFGQNFMIGKSGYAFIHPDDVEYVSKYHDNLMNPNSKQDPITHRILTNYITYDRSDVVENINGRCTYVWVTTNAKKLDNIIVSCSLPITIKNGR
jgi:hypothetical protein